MVSDSTTQKPASAIPLTRLAISPSEWHYLKVKITSEHTLSEHIDNLAFRLFIAQALGSTYGIVGSALFVDVLDWDDDALVGILKVASGPGQHHLIFRLDRIYRSSDLPTLWSALTLFNLTIESHSCMLEVLGVSGSKILGDLSYLATCLTWRPLLLGDLSYLATSLTWRPLLLGDLSYLATCLTYLGPAHMLDGDVSVYIDKYGNPGLISCPVTREGLRRVVESGVWARDFKLCREGVNLDRVKWVPGFALKTLSILKIPIIIPLLQSSIPSPARKVES
ncbi:hypothetical protein BC936DRAFT_138624 [Jimgerdemannia flammicorona]|uniref:Ribonucleases P/MRP subunit Pop8-like domain-containing protein n=1 Tax=Jimgerdemannia flammicorona TaxID=994334 RepID=A0A433BXG0_9FUNG|nr:hypothetical protein BC936DRAFT_138624 [Jimgerdemannia flammicorona]